MQAELPPINPTDAMIAAGIEASTVVHSQPRAEMTDIWKAMYKEWLQSHG